MINTETHRPHTQRLLATPFMIGSLTLANRTVMTPMGTDLANPDGTPGPRLLAYWLERAKGGCGLIIAEITRVNEKHGAGTGHQFSLSKDAHVAPLREAIEQIHATGAKFFPQLHHPGAEGIPALCEGGVTVSPSGVMVRTTKAPTRALSLEEVESLVDDFVQAARRAKEAGADGVEIHGAHGYLVCQFLSPHTNHRTDRFGGDFDGRMRFVTEIIEGIREECGADFPISVRISASEMMETIGEPGEGITLEEGVRIAKRLEEIGVDLISVSSGTYETGPTIIEPINTPRNWRDPVIRAVREAVKVPVMGTSIVRMPSQAEKMLDDGLVDLVAMGRTWLADPAWAKKAIEGRDEEIVRCIGCLACFQTLNMGKPIMCALNPRCGHEYEYPEVPDRDLEGRSALVIGGGPAGCEAAEQLALRGAHVVLAEARDHLGGQVAPGCNPPGKEPMHWIIENYGVRLRLAGVDVRFSQEMTLQSACDFGADIVIVATGALPFLPPLPGMDSANVVEAIDVLNGSAEVGRRVAIVGSGMTGLETAELLHEQGHEVIGVYEMADAIAPGSYKRNVDSVASHLVEAGIGLNCGHQLLEVNEGTAVFSTSQGQVDVELDTLVMAIGMRPNDGLAKELESAGIPAISVGDATGVARVAEAVESGFRAARGIVA
ncbi:MAG: NAD(P)/FAD-dependent oxidoreductase [Actinomycetaceae bacterium]|nr:NAD(P)/FAD-dependent oxidoreductase [Arcanobacterium sp.]MDD7504345.1 NAD(P)/FAD-dependent oxidoreductase [Actinomycetaceae bacterium]MDY6143009.1 NAD(P)/FAD-dependent oxidoreductase [Arcanobacterium sp.]